MWRIFYHRLCYLTQADVSAILETPKGAWDKVDPWSGSAEEHMREPSAILSAEPVSSKDEAQVSIITDYCLGAFPT
jgi:hypothetical protein